MLSGLTTLAVIASGDESFAVERDYYKKAVHWDEARAQQGHNTRLGWTAAVNVERRDRASGHTALALRLLDRSGLPLSDATVTAEVFHNARAAEVVDARFIEQSPGKYGVELPMRRLGIWEVRLTAIQHGRRFTQAVRLDLQRKDGA
jgi:hypothetical protein